MVPSRATAGTLCMDGQAALEVEEGQMEGVGALQQHPVGHSGVQGRAVACIQGALRTCGSLSSQAQGGQVRVQATCTPSPWATASAACWAERPRLEGALAGTRRGWPRPLRRSPCAPGGAGRAASAAGGG